MMRILWIRIRNTDSDHWTCRKEGDGWWRGRLRYILAVSLMFIELVCERKGFCLPGEWRRHLPQRIRIDPRIPAGRREPEHKGDDVIYSAVFRIRIQLNPDPDPAKNINPDPEDLKSGSGSKIFLNTIWKKLKLLHNYKISSSKEVNWKIECCIRPKK